MHYSCQFWQYRFVLDKLRFELWALHMPILCQRCYEIVLYALCDSNRKSSTKGFTLSKTMFASIMIIGSIMTVLKFLAGPLTFHVFCRGTKSHIPVWISACFSKAPFMMVGRILWSMTGPYFTNSAEMFLYPADRLCSFLILFITSSFVTGESNFCGFLLNAFDTLAVIFKLILKVVPYNFINLLRDNYMSSIIIMYVRIFKIFPW